MEDRHIYSTTVDLEPVTTDTMEVAGISIGTEFDNNDKLTEQVLTLPREYQPINLKIYHILQTDNSTTGNKNISVSIITMPTLPGIPNNIACETSICPKEQCKINLIIDLLLLNNVCVQLSKQTDKVWDDD